MRPPWAMLAIAIAERGGVAGHLEGDVEALDHAQLALDVLRGRARAGRRRSWRPSASRARAGRRSARDTTTWRAPAWRTTGIAMSPIGPGAGDEDVLAEDLERERRVDRVPERVEDRRDLLVDARPVVPDVGHRQGDVLREGAVPAHAEPDGVRAEVALAGHAVPAPAAGHVALAADEVARVEVADVAPTSTISPTNSWPTTSGGSIVFAAHASHDSMCRSVPQMPVLWTRIRTSLMPISGLRHLLEPQPGPRVDLDQGEHQAGVPISCRISSARARSRRGRRRGLGRRCAGRGRRRRRRSGRRSACRAGRRRRDRRTAAPG